MVTETKNGYIRDVSLNKKTTSIVVVSIIVAAVIVVFLNKQAKKLF